MAAANLKEIFRKYPIQAKEKAAFLDRVFARFNNEELKAATDKIFKMTH